jgi:hypothetical protein
MKPNKPKTTARAIKHRKTYQQLRAAGLCTSCRQPTEAASCLCADCRMAAKLRYRAASRSKPWTPGGRGRPPIAFVREMLEIVDWSLSDEQISDWFNLSIKTVQRHRPQS